MATTRLNRLRTIGALVAAAVLAWITWQTIHAGTDIPSQRSTSQTQLTGGSANDKRLDGKSWSLDYDSASVSPDGSLAEIENVHDGVILRDGRPYMRMMAKHVSANLAVNDFVVTGPVSFTEIGGQHRELFTDEAHYSGNTHTLFLDHPTTIHAAAMSFRVASAVVNFTTGETKLGRITGSL
ncbi:MAG TPA: LPS export ABC transporter periplasmic protein LptC [Candidatus Lustribacter sp.]|jgi:lipopolysaccharide export system protein LptC|nr:LPS export ABC transporter periplasmic protein LptC [Candidatus Lustribacter sp.]